LKVGMKGSHLKPVYPHRKLAFYGEDTLIKRV